MSQNLYFLFFTILQQLSLITSKNTILTHQAAAVAHQPMCNMSAMDGYKR